MAAKPNWTGTKAKLADFDRKQLVELIQDLYRSSRENQTFLHARFALGEDVLEPYRSTIERWMWPDVFRHQEPSVAKAKKAITDYQKAVGDPAGLAELMVVFCERGIGFSAEFGNDDQASLNALCRMFEGALHIVATLPSPEHDRLLARLRETRDCANRLGYGVFDWMTDLLISYTPDDGDEPE